MPAPTPAPSDPDFGGAGEAHVAAAIPQNALRTEPAPDAPVGAGSTHLWPNSPAGTSAIDLDDDDFNRLRALQCIAKGEDFDSDAVRDLIGIGYAHATTTQLMITDEGRAWLNAIEARVGEAPVADTKCKKL
jgi:hypothetical protein